MAREAPACGLGGKVSRKTFTGMGEGLEIVSTEASRTPAVRRVALKLLNVKREKGKEESRGWYCGKDYSGVCCSPSRRESLPPQKQDPFLLPTLARPASQRVPEHMQRAVCLETFDGGMRDPDFFYFFLESGVKEKKSKDFGFPVYLFLILVNLCMYFSCHS